MGAKLTEAMKACLTYYRDNEHNPIRRQALPYRFSRREMNRALDLDYLMVGPGGWHILTPAGRLALQESPDAQPE